MARRDDYSTLVLTEFFDEDPRDARMAEIDRTVQEIAREMGLADFGDVSMPGHGPASDEWTVVYDKFSVRHR